MAKEVGPKIILWDVENTHNKVAAFQMFYKNGGGIPHENVLQERYIVCASWMELNETKPHGVMTLDDAERFAKHPEDDYHVVKTMHDVLAEADAIVGHNGDQFDWPLLQSRIIYHKLSPLPPVHKIDTLKVARSKFMFNSNRLDYLARYLGVGKKIKTDNELWLDVLAGKPKAIREMSKYNKWDVVMLKEVFLKLRPYMDNYINLHAFGGDVTACPRCGSSKVKEEEVHHSPTQVYPRFQCVNCGGWYRFYKGHRSTKTRML